MQPDRTTSSKDAALLDLPMIAALHEQLSAILVGGEPFGALVLAGPAPAAPAADGAAVAPGDGAEDSPWPHIPGPGKSAMSAMEVGAFFARLVGQESLYHVVAPKGVRYRKLTALLGDKYSIHGALLSVWLDQAGLLEPATDAAKPWAQARLLTTEDLMQLAVRLKATPLPEPSQVSYEKGRGLA